jgi:hypothetical protein
MAPDAENLVFAVFIFKHLSAKFLRRRGRGELPEKGPSAAIWAA